MGTFLTKVFTPLLGNVLSSERAQVREQRQLAGRQGAARVRRRGGLRGSSELSSSSASSTTSSGSFSNSSSSNSSSSYSSSSSSSNSSPYPSPTPAPIPTSTSNPPPSLSLSEITQLRQTYTLQKRNLIWAFNGEDNIPLEFKLYLEEMEGELEGVQREFERGRDVRRWRKSIETH